MMKAILQQKLSAKERADSTPDPEPEEAEEEGDGEGDDAVVDS